MRNPVAFIATLALTSILAWHAVAGERCASPDNVTSVSGTGHCLQIKTYTPPDGSVGTLAVVLHGALSRGGDADYIIGTARISATYGAVGVAMARPGYTLDGRTSTGVATRDKHPWHWHRADEIDSIAAAVAGAQEASRLGARGDGGPPRRAPSFRASRSGAMPRWWMPSS